LNSFWKTAFLSGFIGNIFFGAKFTDCRLYDDEKIFQEFVFRK
jgi:hypothetical protein